jgi:hypothetical protein
MCLIDYSDSAFSHHHSSKVCGSKQIAMKCFIFQISLILASQCSAFVTNNPTFVFPSRTSTVLHAVQLKPEPEGGEEMEGISTMAGSRMKKMKEMRGITEGDELVYNFWLTATADAALIKAISTKVLKDASKKAEFPGFRKVSDSLYDYSCRVFKKSQTLD